MRIVILAPFVIWLVVPQVAAQGTAFTYQGRLSDNSQPAGGIYDFRFRLATDPAGNNFSGNPVLLGAVPVSNGLFTAVLDFAQSPFDGTPLWLQIEVRTNGAASYVKLAPLQSLTSTPYALFASTVGAVPPASVSGAYTNAVIFTNASNSFSGAFTGNGVGLTNLTGVVTNALEVLLFTNKTAIYRGHTYSFSNSTTAGLNELQQLFPRQTSGGPSGLAIRLADSGEYTFTSPIFISNNISIVGAGLWSSGFCYRGPTNLWSINTVMTSPQSAGLFNVTTNNVVPMWAFGPNLSLSQLYIKTASDFPCILPGQTH